MALNQVGLERLNTATTKKIGTNKNLIINGAMQVAQRGTSSTTSGYGTVDRFKTTYSGTDEAPTQAQVDVASGTTPYTLGFRKALKVTNGNQTSGAGAADLIEIMTKLEAQDVANSGWNYLSTSSFITLSFWVKSSVAQNFYGWLYSMDGTARNYSFETGSLTADTWTKVTKVVPGSSSPALQFDDNNGEGLQFAIWPFFGTNYTASGVALNSWMTTNNAERVPDYTSTWYTTNDATFEITGVQLEVGSLATDFEHRSIGKELELCQRYCQRYVSNRIAVGVIGDGTTGYATLPTKVTMRSTPTMSVTTNGKMVKEGTAWYDITTLQIGTSSPEVITITCVASGGHGMSALNPFTVGNGTDFTLNAEL